MRHDNVITPQTSLKANCQLLFQIPFQSCIAYKYYNDAVTTRNLNYYLFVSERRRRTQRSWMYVL